MTFLPTAQTGNKGTKIRTLVLGSALALSAFNASAVTYHVAPTGDDAAAGSASAPWKTIAKANRTLQAGDTVLLHAGSYDDTIRPLNDGSSNDNRIVYRAFGDGNVVLRKFSNVSGATSGALGLGNKRYVTVSGRAEGDSASSKRIHLAPQIDVESLGNVCGSEGVVIENIFAECPSNERNCSRGLAFCINYWDGEHESKFNVLRNSHIVGHSSTSGSASDFTEDLVTLAKSSHHNLIEGNVFENCRHSVIYADSPQSHSNVLRNNVIRNPQHTALSLWSAGVGLADGARFLIENNYLEGAGRTIDPHGGPGNALQWGADELLVRYNVITQGGSANQHHKAVGGLVGGTSTTHGAPYFATDGRIYNNTIVKNSGVAIGLLNFNVSPVDLGRHRFLNNFIYGSDAASTTRGQLVLYWDQDFNTADRYVRNVFGNPGGTDIEGIVSNHRNGLSSVTAASVNFSSPVDPDFADWHGFSNVYDAAPGFSNYANDDYRLSGGSRYVDGGAPLTVVTATDTGSGTSLSVADTRVFFAEASEFPSWMEVTPDWIAVGPSLAEASRVQVTAVNDVSNRLTLASAVSRKAGDFVWLWKDSDGTQVVRGNAPDIGAYESPQQSTKVLPPKNFRFQD